MKVLAGSGCGGALEEGDGIGDEERARGDEHGGDRSRPRARAGSTIS